MPGHDSVRRPAPGVKLTYDDLVLLYPEDDGLRHELIDGEHYVSPAPITNHQRVCGNLYFLLRSHLEHRPVGEVFFAPFDVIFTRFDVVEPDILYLSKERAATILTSKNIQGSPELVIEIGSPGTRRRDATIKRRLYEREDVSEYWIVDPDAELIRFYRRGKNAFEPPIELSREAGDVLTTPLLPGLKLRLADVFKD